MGACASLSHTDSPQVSPAHRKRTRREPQVASSRETTPTNTGEHDSLLLPSIHYVRPLGTVSPVDDWKLLKYFGAPDVETGELNTVPNRFSTLSDSTESTISDVTNPRNSLVLLEERIALREEFFRTERRRISQNIFLNMEVANRPNSELSPFLHEENRAADKNDDGSVDVTEMISAPVVIPSESTPAPTACSQSTQPPGPCAIEQSNEAISNLQNGYNQPASNDNNTPELTEELNQGMSSGSPNAADEVTMEEAAIVEPGDTIDDDSTKSQSASESAKDETTEFLIAHNVPEIEGTTGTPSVKSITTVSENGSSDAQPEGTNIDILEFGKDLVEEGKLIQQQLAEMMAQQNERERMQEEINRELSKTRQSSEGADLPATNKIQQLLEEGRRLKKAIAELNKDDSESNESVDPTNSEEISVTSTVDQHDSESSKSVNPTANAEETSVTSTADQQNSSNESVNPTANAEENSVSTKADQPDSGTIHPEPKLTEFNGSEEGYDSDALLDEYNMVTYADIDSDPETDYPRGKPTDISTEDPKGVEADSSHCNTSNTTENTAETAEKIASDTGEQVSETANKDVTADPGIEEVDKKHQQLVQELKQDYKNMDDTLKGIAELRERRNKKKMDKTDTSSKDVEANELSINADDTLKTNQETEIVSQDSVVNECPPEHVVTSDDRALTGSEEFNTISHESDPNVCEPEEGYTQDTTSQAEPIITSQESDQSEHVPGAQDNVLKESDKSFAPPTILLEDENQAMAVTQAIDGVDSNMGSLSGAAAIEVQGTSAPADNTNRTIPDDKEAPIESCITAEMSEGHTSPATLTGAEEVSNGEGTDGKQLCSENVEIPLDAGQGPEITSSSTPKETPTHTEEQSPKSASEKPDSSMSTVTLPHCGPLNPDSKFKVYSFAMKLQQEMAKMQVQMFNFQAQMRATDNALQNLMDMVIEEMEKQE